MGRSTVEILFFEGCPNYERTRGLVEQASVMAGVEFELRLVEVASHAAAERLRFLGSPSVRVNGQDVEPGADGTAPPLDGHSRYSELSSARR